MTNKLIEVAKVLSEALSGDYLAQGRIKAIAKGDQPLREAISTSDLARAFTAIVSQEVLSQYAELPSQWTDFAQRKVVNDFRPTEFREVIWDEDGQATENGGFPVQPGSLPVVPELTEYPSAYFTTGEAEFKIRKHGLRVPFSWESVINDEWSLIQSIPGMLARKAKETEDTEAISLLVDRNGPNANVFTGVAAPDDVPLTLDNLAAAQAKVLARKVNGRYVTVSRWRLIVPTALELKAKQILAITGIKQVVTEGDTVTEFEGVNPLTGNIQLTVSDRLTRQNGAAKAAQTWFLVPEGGTDGTRSALVVGFLRGYEAPEFRQSGNTGLYLGGGNVPSLEGSLLNDDIEYRVRHVVTGAALANHALYASTGGALPV